MSAPAASPPVFKYGIVKQVLSGDSIIIRGQPKGGPPPEKQIVLSGITAPKLGRQRTEKSEETRDEPFAFEAREFLRTKLIGKEVSFTIFDNKNASLGPGKEYGNVFIGNDPQTAENVTEMLVAAGLARVRDGARNSPIHKQLVDLEEQARTHGKGVWGSDLQKHVRDVKWVVDPKSFVSKNEKPVKAIIEYVRDGSTVRALLLPDYQMVTVLMSGIRAVSFRPNEDEGIAQEARYFVESRLLQRDVEIRFESVNNNNLVGTILHPQGNIAEMLLREGFARCVDWSLAVMKSGASELRAAERSAKERRVKIWKDYTVSAPRGDKEFIATVIEVVSGDSLSVKLADGTVKKIFLASIKPPAQKGDNMGEDGKPIPRPKGFRPLYEIPWMFEAREFLRKKLIGKKITITVDYTQPAKDNRPEKICCTIVVGGVNLAEALVSKGLATVVRYKQDDDQRSMHYDKLFEAEVKATKAGVGVHAKKDIPSHRVRDFSSDEAKTKAKLILPYLERAQKTDAIVEFVASGARLRVYVPKETCLITFLLGGVNCPRAGRPAFGSLPAQSAEPFGDEALHFTRDRCMQREVKIKVDGMDKNGNFFGWLWVENVNLSVALIENGLASMHFSAEQSEYARELKNAETLAKTQKLGRWHNYVEEEKEKVLPDSQSTFERKVNHIKVMVCEVTEEGHFYAQKADEAEHLLAMMEKLHQEFQLMPPLPGATTPKRGQTIAARFSFDDQWYRARVEKEFADHKYLIHYFDYGNREAVSFRPNEDEGIAQEARYFVESRLLQRDVEIRFESVNNNNLVGTILHPQGNIAEMLLREGFARCVDWSLAVMKSGASELRAAERSAKERRVKIWKDYTVSAPRGDKEFIATVIEVVSGDSLSVKLADGTVKKIFLASIKPPAQKGDNMGEDGKPIPRPKGFRPLYEIPWMFEAREFLRKKLIGKKITITVDYTQPAKDNRPEKICCTIVVGGVNLAEALVSKGLATVVRYKQDDDQRSMHYDKLFEAEVKATKAGVGVHAKKDIPSHRVRDFSSDEAKTKAKLILPYLERAQKTDAIVEFVASGARLRVYVPKETCLITFLLGGVNCPRAGRPAFGSLPAQSAEPFGDEALHFTRDRCMQREVKIKVDGMDKNGNFFGWLWVENVNLSVALIENGLASMHFSAEQSEYARELKNAETLAKTQKLGRWHNYVEEEKEKVLPDSQSTFERKVNHIKVMVCEVTEEGHFYAQKADEAEHLLAMMEKLHQEFQLMPPLPGATTPKRGQTIAARFSFDDQWYRARVEKEFADHKYLIHYFDYGNREIVSSTRCAALPASYATEKPYATEYTLACVTFPTDPEDREEAVRALKEDILNKTLLLNIENPGPPPAVTLTDPAVPDSDIAKTLIADGLLLANLQKDRRLTKLIGEYKAAQETAKKNRMNLWRFGDITEDDAKEFGVARK